ncbi:hypothetical protein [Methylibium rhizosphaerae]|uniref:hypothetical protein n=1 Tax=Methylibium rhizosphaerae TaxID=2570323 RepID=UPI001128FF82|nr:hypothetical protein [Methylibium rhizosphaerae]
MNGAGIFARVRLRLGVLAWRHGAAWGAVALLAMVAAGVELARREVSRAVPDVPPQVTAERGIDPAPPGESENTRSVFPSADVTQELVAALLRLAAAQGLQIDQAEYQYQRSGHGWLEMRMTVPLRGSYPAARGLVEGLLRRHPNVALEGLSLKRESAASSEVLVVVRFTAWFEEEAADRRLR